MSFVGKILVVLQVVLSVMFMAFAGAVYSTHMNWRTVAMKSEENVKKARSEINDLQTEFDKFKTASTAKLNLAENRASKAEADNVGLKQQVDQITKEKNDLGTQFATANQLAQIAGEEAKARRAESIELREINTRLLASRDAGVKQISKLEDSIQSLKLDYGAAQQKVKDLLNQVALFQRKLESLNVSIDPKELLANVNVPPRVDGYIRETMAAKAQGNSELVEVSLGSDDGLAKGHTMFVYRSGLKDGGRPKFLGKIRIVSTTPDLAVGVVLEETKTGVIQKGDHVTTKL